MNEEKILDAIGLIDNDIIEETEKIRNKKRPFPIRKVGLIAACITLAFISVSTLLFIFREKKPIAAEKEESGLPPHTSYIDEENTSYSNGQNENLPIGESEENNIGGESLSDNSVATLPLYISVTAVKESGFICRIIDAKGNEEFKPGDILTVHILEDTVLPDGGLSEGDSVYMIFGKARYEDLYTVCAYHIYTEEGETTPALFD